MIMALVQCFQYFLFSKVFIRNLRLQRADIFYFLVNLPAMLILIQINQIAAMILSVILLMIYLSLLTRSIKNAVLIASLIFSMGVLMDHIIDIVLGLLNVPNRDIVYSVALLIMGLVVAIGLSFFLKSDFENNLQDSYHFSNLEVTLSAGILIAIWCLIAWTEILQNNNLQNIFYNLGIFLLVIVIFITVHNARTKTMKKDFELREQRTRNESTNRYIFQIEKHYEELRKFRHDYQNTLLSLDEYLRTDDMEGLKKYYNESIRPISVKLNREKYKFEDLSRIDNKEIKSILFNKLYAAQLMGIKVSFEAKNEIKDFKVDSLDLALAFGIILDNAIEETQKQEHGTIQVGLIKNETSIVIIVQNSLRKNDIPVWKMKERGYSSKGPNRGFGLKNLTEIIDRNDNATLETMKLNNYFLQKIVINTKG